MASLRTHPPQSPPQKLSSGKNEILNRERKMRGPFSVTNLFLPSYPPPPGWGRPVGEAAVPHEDGHGTPGTPGRDPGDSCDTQGGGGRAKSRRGGKFAAGNFADTPRNVVACQALQPRWSLAMGASFPEHPAICVGNFAANLKREIPHTKLTASEITASPPRVHRGTAPLPCMACTGAVAHPVVRGWRAVCPPLRCCTGLDGAKQLARCPSARNLAASGLK